jgi:hypothetical protein
MPLLNVSCRCCQHLLAAAGQRGGVQRRGPGTPGTSRPQSASPFAARRAEFRALELHVRRRKNAAPARPGGALATCATGSLRPRAAARCWPATSWPTSTSRAGRPAAESDRGCGHDGALDARGDVARYRAGEGRRRGLLTDVAGLLGRAGRRAQVNASAHLLEPGLCSGYPPAPCCLVLGIRCRRSRRRALRAFVHHARLVRDRRAAAMLEAQAALEGGLPSSPVVLRAGGRRVRAGLRAPDGAVAPDARLARRHRSRTRRERRAGRDASRALPAPSPARQRSGRRVRSAAGSWRARPGAPLAGSVA